jgi:hypothetical protein
MDVIAFQKRVQIVQNAADYQPLKDELAKYVQSLSPDERRALREQAKPVWADLHSRIDAMLAELSQPNPVAA